MQSVQPTHPDAVLSEHEAVLLEQELSGDTPVLLLRSNTRVDTGNWLKRSRLWLCVTEAELLLFAASKRRYAQRLPLSECRSSAYCHTSGALLLHPSDHWRFHTVALDPSDALMVLEHVERPTPPENQSPVTESTVA